MNIFGLVRTQQQSYVALAQWFCKSCGTKPEDIAPGAIPALVDWARFSRLLETPYDPDARLHALLTGRHEAGWRFLNHLIHTPEQLIQLRKIPFNKETDSV